MYVEAFRGILRSLSLPRADRFGPCALRGFLLGAVIGTQLVTWFLLNDRVKLEIYRIFDLRQTSVWAGACIGSAFLCLQ
jgi:hypothetical protein